MSFFVCIVWCNEYLAFFYLAKLSFLDTQVGKFGCVEGQRGNFYNGLPSSGFLLNYFIISIIYLSIMFIITFFFFTKERNGKEKITVLGFMVTGGKVLRLPLLIFCVFL